MAVLNSLNNGSSVTFIIVSYNSSKVLADAIASCLTAVQTLYPHGKVVAYDNASTDSCPQILDGFSTQYPHHFVGIKGNQNLGFGAANNRAAALEPSDFYVLVNPDVTFAPETVPQLVSTLQTERDIAIVCPKLLYLDESVQPSIRRFPSFSYFMLRQLLGESVQRLLHPFDYYYAQVRPPEDVVEVNWAIGAFMVVSGDYVRRHGLFDERFFLYFEDMSLCVDAWQHGYRVLFQPEAVAFHSYNRASTRSKFNYLTLLHTISALKFFAKYRPYKKRWKIVTWMLQLGSQSRQGYADLKEQVRAKFRKYSDSLLQKRVKSA